MLFIYDDYENQMDALKFMEFQRIHFLMQQEIGDDKDALELYDALVEIATDYARMRSQWSIFDKEWRLQNDKFRTSIHESLIIHFNMLSRYLKSIGKEAVWREELGDEKRDSNNRKRIGDFGCYLVFVHGLSAR